MATMGGFAEAQRHPNGIKVVPQMLENIGAGEGNRTLVFSLEGLKQHFPPTSLTIISAHDFNTLGRNRLHSRSPKNTLDLGILRPIRARKFKQEIMLPA
jgi:hypothetical protein